MGVLNHHLLLECILVLVLSVSFGRKLELFLSCAAGTAGAARCNVGVEGRVCACDMIMFLCISIQIANCSGVNATPDSVCRTPEVFTWAGGS